MIHQKANCAGLRYYETDGFTNQKAPEWKHVCVSMCFLRILLCVCNCNCNCILNCICWWTACCHKCCLCKVMQAVARPAGSALGWGCCGGAQGCCLPPGSSWSSSALPLKTSASPSASSPSPWWSGSAAPWGAYSHPHRCGDFDVDIDDHHRCTIICIFPFGSSLSAPTGALVCSDDALLYIQPFITIHMYSFKRLCQLI